MIISLVNTHLDWTEKKKQLMKTEKYSREMERNAQRENATAMSLFRIERALHFIEDA